MHSLPLPSSTEFYVQMAVLVSLLWKLSLPLEPLGLCSREPVCSASSQKQLLANNWLAQEKRSQTPCLRQNPQSSRPLRPDWGCPLCPSRLLPKPFCFPHSLTSVFWEHLCSMTLVHPHLCACFQGAWAKRESHHCPTQSFFLWVCPLPPAPRFPFHVPCSWTQDIRPCLPIFVVSSSSIPASLTLLVQATPDENPWGDIFTNLVPFMLIANWSTLASLFFRENSYLNCTMQPSLKKTFLDLPKSSAFPLKNKKSSNFTKRNSSTCMLCLHLVHLLLSMPAFAAC
jgi:hypothetical protein